ncbi:hypothetical protein [Hyphococcus sp. DH-69]|uniref:hypothetical protein n=1 Tax=Hyphococcus formosus TaxID=3143534 RepID=UPI00398A816C
MNDVIGVGDFLIGVSAAVALTGLFVSYRTRRLAHLDFPPLDWRVKWEKFEPNSYTDGVGQFPMWGGDFRRIDLEVRLKSDTFHITEIRLPWLFFHCFRRPRLYKIDAQLRPRTHDGKGYRRLWGGLNKWSFYVGGKSEPKHLMVKIEMMGHSQAYVWAKLRLDIYPDSPLNYWRGIASI